MKLFEAATTPDPVVEAYKAGVDRTLFERTLGLTPSQRIEQLQQFVAFLAGVHDAGRRLTVQPRGDQAD